MVGTASQNTVDWDGTNGPRVARAISEARVLDVLQRAPASRAAISRATGLSKPTVSAVVRDLEGIGLLRRGGQAPRQIGRSSTLYEVNPAAAYALGIDIGGTKVRAGITDLFGAPLAEIAEGTRRDEASQLTAQLTRLLDRLVVQADVPRADVRAAGISVPGVLHPDSDTVTAAYNVPALHDMHLHRDFEAALGMPVVLGNDVNLAAAGEQWRGSAVGVANFVAMSIGTGVGLGIVIDGSIRAGAKGGAGEIGWLPLKPGAVDFERTPAGAFEDAVSAPAILRRLVAALEAGARSSLGREASLLDLFAAASSGDGLAIDLVDEEARLIAFGIAALTAVLDPERVVLGGGIGANKELLEPVRRHVGTMIPQPPLLVTSVLRDRASFHGAVAVALDALRERLMREGRRGERKNGGSDQGTAHARLISVEPAG